MIRVMEESQVVADPALRKKIIMDINSPENCARKDEAYRRHLCYKDNTKHYVLTELLKQFDPTTVLEMNYSLSNLSLGRKIIDKLARVYSNGVQRKVEPETAQEALDEVAKLVDMNRTMKRTNRYLRAHHNTIVGVLPCPYYDNGSVTYEIKVQAFQPHLYDVIENPHDREKPMFIILSNYKPTVAQGYVPDAASRGNNSAKVAPVSDGKDQSVADKKEDENNEQYIWWSKKYHFTTNAKGEIIKLPGQLKIDINNPIQDMTFVNFALDQEGSFWAEGGDDIFDGAVRVNCMITNMDHIGVNQGYGQFWMKGKNLPKNVKAGVNKAILLEQDSKEDPEMSIGFASSNPKLQELKDQVVMYVALLLTTNNLSTRSVSTQLGSGQDFASGISLIIDKAESIEDVQDQRDIFEKNEPEIFKKIQKWQAVYKNSLTESYKKYLLPNDFKLSLKFNDARPIMSEKEKLEVIKLRKELGINRAIELLMIDDPSLTEKQAEERLKVILEEKISEGLKEQTDGNPDQPDQEDGSVADQDKDEVDQEEDDADDESDQGDGQ